VVGIDGPAAEILVNLLTGASLPDEGLVHLFGRATAAITDADDWLATLDHLGIVSARAVLLDDLSVAQNVATAFTLSIDPVADAVMVDVRRLAAETGIAEAQLANRVAEVSPEVKARCHLAKALALNPSLLVLEHANAIAPAAATAFGRTMNAAARSRRLSMVVLTADQTFARAAATRVLALNPATGAFTDRSGWRKWFHAGTGETGSSR
jgi:ABC-type lipoprotein export system ATPase subunit